MYTIWADIGNDISSMAVNINALNNPLLYNYQYDQLNRLVAMDAWHKPRSAWSNITKLSDFQERVSYDANGNILGYKRNGNNTFAGKPLGMDSLTYSYVMGINRLNKNEGLITVGNRSGVLVDKAGKTIATGGEVSVFNQAIKETILGSKK